MTPTLWGLIAVVSLLAALFLWYKIAGVAKREDEEMERQWKELQEAEKYERITTL